MMSMKGRPIMYRIRMKRGEGNLYTQHHNVQIN